MTFDELIALGLPEEQRRFSSHVSNVSALIWTATHSSHASVASIDLMPFSFFHVFLPPNVIGEGLGEVDILSPAAMMPTFDLA